MRLLSSLAARSYSILDPSGEVTPSSVPCTTRNGAATSPKLSRSSAVTRASSRIVPTRGEPRYSRGLDAITLSFAGSRIDLPTILLSGITAHVSARPKRRPYRKSRTRDGYMSSGKTSSGADRMIPAHPASGGERR
ncbi:Os02g0207800 [Oryza sativa Japonica Group]|uniref:Os02g0207800 protein n=2 Tax=Oryza sativa subsp. japonica TaxID=39947 RepID=Q0E2W8_ORYSJ|nr:hypothetical protein EE612_009661 [Oryza sativa]BAF08170.1 Os02g0207800 [Oryza sativa Japonica Group]BAS77568.1 Os02g0207800 [Oryza sativa Japonica Group]|eukprot:NP_001046256.1 Os02g0207800 [Oryza sativa Japonica Group]